MNRTKYNREYARKRRSTKEGREQNRMISLAWRQKNCRTVLLNVARTRALKKGLKFSIREKDISWETHCPILGVKLSYGGMRGRDMDAASLDRLNNKKGYIKGNVFVISWRANRLKSDATREELQAIISYVDKHAIA